MVRQFLAVVIYSLLQERLARLTMFRLEFNRLRIESSRCYPYSLLAMLLFLLYAGLCLRLVHFALILLTCVVVDVAFMDLRLEGALLVLEHLFEFLFLL